MDSGGIGTGICKGEAQKEKSVSDAVRELEDCLLISFSDKQIAMLKTALLTYYKMLFGKVTTEDLLVSRIIIEGKTNKDMQIQQAIEKFIKDNQNVKDFQMSIKKVREILIIYGLDDMFRFLQIIDV